MRGASPAGGMPCSPPHAGPDHTASILRATTSVSFWNASLTSRCGMEQSTNMGSPSGRTVTLGQMWAAVLNSQGCGPSDAEQREPRERAPTKNHALIIRKPEEAIAFPLVDI